MIYFAPVILGSQGRGMFDLQVERLADRWKLEFVEQLRIGSDLRIRAVPRNVP